MIRPLHLLFETIGNISMIKPKIVCVAGGGNNEECIFDFLRDSYVPALFLASINQKCRFIYFDGERRVSKEFPIGYVPSPLRPLLNGYLIFRKVFSCITPPIDVVVADSIYMCTWALRLRGKGMIKKVVYFCGDWFPWHDTSLSFLQRLFRKHIYKRLDIICARNADMVWSVSDRLNAIRAEYAADLLNANKMLKYPMAFKIPKKRGNTDGIQILYIGIPREDHCLEMLIRGMYQIYSRTKASIHLDIVGHSDYVSHLREYVQKYGMEKMVTFHGMILPGPELDTIVSRCNMGFALYRTVGTENYYYYGFPTKIIQYFSFGLPVIASDITEFAGTIRQLSLGYIIPVDESALVNVLGLAMNESMIDFQANIAKFVKEQNEMAQKAYRDRIGMLIDDGCTKA